MKIFLISLLALSAGLLFLSSPAQAKPLKNKTPRVTPANTIVISSAVPRKPVFRVETSLDSRLGSLKRCSIAGKSVKAAAKKRSKQAVCVFNSTNAKKLANKICRQYWTEVIVDPMSLFALQIPVTLRFKKKTSKSVTGFAFLSLDPEKGCPQPRYPDYPF